MADNKHNSDHAQWMHLLDQLEADQKNAEPLTQQQIQNLEELRALVAETSGALDLYAKLDVERGWQDLRAAVQQRGLIPFDSPVESQEQKKTFGRLWMRIAAAAVILLTFSIGGYYFYLKQHKNNYSLASLDSDVQPGGSRATLKWADGRIVDLSTTQEGIVIGQNEIHYIDGSSILPNEGMHPMESGKDPISGEKLVLSTPRGGEYQVTLPDGTKVWLNAASTLTYPVQFTGQERRVELEGEAYFEVVSRPEQPFIVNTKKQSVEVLGTHFNISAYKSDVVTKTTLLEGSVRVVSNRNQQKINLLPNEQSVLEGQMLAKHTVDVTQELAWFYGKFNFDNKSLQQVIDELSRWYDVDISFQGDMPDVEFFGGTFRYTKMSTILRILKSYGIDYRVIGDRRLVLYSSRHANGEGGTDARK